MRKLKEIEEQQEDAVNAKLMDQTTCGEHVRKLKTIQIISFKIEEIVSWLSYHCLWNFFFDLFAFSKIQSFFCTNSHSN